MHESCYPESALDKLGPDDFAGCTGDARPCDRVGCGAELHLGDVAIVTEDGEAFCSEECFEGEVARLAYEDDAYDRARAG
jgi:hypothetical protein